ncbi:MAG: hypothetical protein ABS44_06330 [Chryseobacterium sp. SCN 40-13]|nr:MAG: hypothetical protein ABS44_06330 [Chryseobacterium sp. SCN 40-13]
MKKVKVILFILISQFFYSQISNLDRGIMIGNLVFEGYKALRGKGDSGKKEPDPNAKTVESFCFRNKLDEKITVRVAGTIEEEEIKKEFVIQKGEKECAYNVPKGVYSYEVVLSSKDIYQKGEYKVTEETQMTVNR